MTTEQIIKEMREISRELNKPKADPRAAGAKLLYLVEKLEVKEANCFAELRAMAAAQWISR